MVWKEARRSFTGKLRWVSRGIEYAYNFDGSIAYSEPVNILQQQVLIEGTEDGIWVHRVEWVDVELVKEDSNGGK